MSDTCRCYTKKWCELTKANVMTDITDGIALMRSVMFPSSRCHLVLEGTECGLVRSVIIPPPYVSSLDGLPCSIVDARRIRDSDLKFPGRCWSTPTRTLSLSAFPRLR